MAYRRRTRFKPEALLPFLEQLPSHRAFSLAVLTYLLSILTPLVATTQTNPSPEPADFKCKEIDVDPDDPQHYKLRGLNRCEGLYLENKSSFYWTLLSWTLGRPILEPQGDPWLRLSWQPDPTLAGGPFLDFSLVSLRPERNYRLDARVDINSGRFQGSKRMIDLQGLGAWEIGFLGRSVPGGVFHPLAAGNVEPTSYELKFWVGVAVERARIRLEGPHGAVTLPSEEIPGAPFEPEDEAELSIPLHDLSTPGVYLLKVTIFFFDEAEQQETVELTKNYRFYHGGS